MADSKDEMEIRSTCFEDEEPADCLSRMRDADRKAADEAKMIVEFEKAIRESQNKFNKTKADELDVCMRKQQLDKMKEKHKLAVDKVLKLAEKNAWNVEDLECRKIDVDRRAPEDDTQVELLDPTIVINSNNHKNKVVFYDPKSNKNGNESNCSVDDESCCDQEDSSCSGGGGGCCQETCGTNGARRPSENLDFDYEKEAIRDDLMAMRGKMKLLNNQNRDLLTQVHCASKRTAGLTKNLREIKPQLATICNIENATQGGGGGGCMNTTATDTKTKVLICEIQRLRGLVNDMERDRCQIELAKKVLNLSESGCATCVGSPDECKKRLKELIQEYKKLSAQHEASLSEICNLRDKLDEAKRNYMTYEDRLTIPKEQIAQLEKQLFDLNWVQASKSDAASSDDKYVIENLKHQLHSANQEKSDIQMMLNHHMSELEDKKTKYLAVLQTNEEQKHRIENLIREKHTIAKAYDAEFCRLNNHLKQHIEEFGLLPATLAATQRDLENEKSAREKLMETVENYKNQIDELNYSLSFDDHENDERLRKALEDQNKQLKAKIANSDDNLAIKERLYQELLYYSIQLKRHLELIREESAMQVTKLKDFTQCQKTKYTDYIQSLEQQLAESRAVACSEFKKRDHIDERLRNQIDVLTKNLNAAHKKIAQFVNANKLISTRTQEELCKTQRGPVCS